MSEVIAGRVVVFDDGVLQIARIAPPLNGLVLTGEADEDGYDALLEALAGLCGHDGTGPPEVHLDLSGLDFCDAAALHAMIALADSSRRVVLHRPAPALRALIGIAGWDEVPGLTVAMS